MSKGLLPPLPPPPPPPSSLPPPDKRKNRRTGGGGDNPSSYSFYPTSLSFMAVEILRKLKRVKPSESFGLVSVFCLTALCFLCCCCFFLYLYRRTEALASRGAWVGQQRRGGNGFLDFGPEERGERCDLFEGKWVWDEEYPLYKARDCAFLDEGFRCSENGRPDESYTKWRWQPNHCNLPRFNAKDMLERLRNKRLVFVGDSIGRNQWESLLCLLSSAVKEKSSIYEVNGSPITKHNGFLVFKFRDYNCTIEYYRAPFLVVQSRPPPGLPKEVITTLKLEVMDWTSSRWRDADLLVFNTGHWWNHEKTIRSGCYFQDGGDVKMEMSVENAYRRSILTLVDWIHKEVNITKTQVIYRTYAPVHFRGGDWKTGGSCHLETLPELDAPEPRRKPWAPLLKTVGDVFSEHATAGMGSMIDMLNITAMTDERKDGHSSVYYLGPKTPAPLHRQDCSHWCLPGVPDAWNELLYALFLRRDSKTSNQYSSTSQTEKRLY